MAQPHYRQHNLCERWNGQYEHHDKAKAHKESHSGEEGQFGFYSHTALLRVTFQILSVELGREKPGMQSVGTLAETNGSQ